MNFNSLYRQMRIVIFYDLPTTSKTYIRAHSKFRNQLNNLGFFMLQESIYVKQCINNDKVQQILSILKKDAPNIGDIRIMLITESQYQRTIILRGEKTLNEKMQYQEELVVI